jgi:TrmH family RNA methyltransferase
MLAITSRQNEKVKLARALQRRKAREDVSQFLIEGTFHIGEAAAAGWPLEFVLYVTELLRGEYAVELVDKLRAAGVECLEVSAEIMDSLTGKDNPQGLLAVARQQFAPLSSVQPQPSSLFLAVVTPQDPGNLGSILRTLDAAGGDSLLVLDGGVDPYHPTAVRAGMGAHFSQPIIQASFGEFVNWAREHGIQVVGSSARAGLDYLDAQYPRPLALLLGSEREGLPPEQLAACEQIVSLPMRGRVTSLNLAVAAGILVYAIQDARNR